MAPLVRIRRSVPRAAMLAAALAACHPSGPGGTPGPDAGWVGTWGTAPQLTEPANMPPEPGLAGNTLRQVVRVSVGGDRLRARFSNEFGTGPMTLDAVHVAASAGGGAIDPATGRALTFGGSPSVTLPPGGTAGSDPFAFPLRPLSGVAITTRFGAVPADLTGHPGSRTTSYVQAGDAVTAADLSGAVRTDHWYVATGIDVVAADAAAVVTLGNSITDGRGSGTNRNNRWPDELARRLQADPRTARVAVLNQGIGGNCVLRACLGMIDRAHARGVRVYGATILPFGGSFYDSPEHEAARQAVNRWIRTGGRFDAVVDPDAALRDPANPSRLRPEADTGDHLHPNETGHRMMGEAVDLALFAGR